MPTEIKWIHNLSKCVIQLEGQVAFLYKHLGIEFVPESPGRLMIHASSNCSRRETSSEAIKLHREIFSSGAQDAIAAITEIQGRLGL